MIRIIVSGLGVVGSEAARQILERPDMKCVGVVDVDSAKLGKDLGEILGLSRKLGIEVSQTLSSVLVGNRADVVLDCTRSFVKEIQESLFSTIKSGMNFVSTSEELAYPAAQYPELAHEIDNLAKRYSVTVLATGINPGFSLDLLPLTLMSVCSVMKRVRAKRVADASVYATEPIHFGIGKSLGEFEEELASGTIRGHIGFPEQIREIADAVGMRITDIKETRKASTSKTRRRGRFLTVEPGQVCGVEQVCIGLSEEEETITLSFQFVFQPDDAALKEDSIAPGDHIFIEGEPNVEATIKTGASGLVTASHAVNAIPYVVQAPPGLLTMKDCPPFAPLWRAKA